MASGPALSILLQVIDLCGELVMSRPWTGYPWVTCPSLSSSQLRECCLPGTMASLWLWEHRFLSRADAMTDLSRTGREESGGQGPFRGPSGLLPCSVLLCPSHSPPWLSVWEGKVSSRVSVRRSLGSGGDPHPTQTSDAVPRLCVLPRSFRSLLNISHSVHLIPFLNNRINNTPVNI